MARALDRSGGRRPEAVRDEHAAAPKERTEKTPRFRPSRAGICNVWEFDDQEFVFSGGRLVLRGANTAGKSKALELLFPFVLDGETRPERLDPFGSRSKTMLYNLVGFAPDVRRVAIGYVWLEFERHQAGDDARFVTVVVGMRATASGGEVETWFGVTDQRIGVDLDLAPDKRPLTRERFQQALGDHGRFSTKASAHREAVDRALFGLGADRFGALIHLILALRRPKLSEKLDLSALSDVLADALEPLAFTRVQNLADAFGRLESQRRAAGQLERQSAEFARFVGAYQRYALVAVGEASQTLLDAEAALVSGAETSEDLERRRREAEHALYALEQDRAGVAERRDQAAGQLEALDLADIKRAGDARQEAAEAVQGEQMALERLEARRLDLEEAERRLVLLEARRASLAEELEAALVDLRKLYARLGITVPDSCTTASSNEPDAIGRVAAVARAGLVDLRARAHAWRRQRREREWALLGAEGDLGRARRDADRALGRHEHEQAAMVEAERRLADAHAAYQDAVCEWARAAGVTDGSGLATQIVAAERPGEAAHAAVSRIGQRMRGALLTELAHFGSGDEPKGWRQLWRLIEFTDDADEVARRGLEAALFASRLALVLVPIPDDQREEPGPGTLRWADPDAPPPGVPLSRWLRATEPHPDVDRLLEAVGAIEGPGPWISVDGSWSLGGLHGAAGEIPSAVLGHSTGARALGERRAALEALLEEFPLPTCVVEARSKAGEQRRRLVDAREALDAAQAAAEAAGRAAAEARTLLTEPQEGDGCDTGVLEALEHRLQALEVGAEELTRHLDEAARSEARSRAWLATDEAEANRAVRRAAHLRGVAEELAQCLGDDQADVLAARDRLLGLVAQCDDQLAGMAARRDGLMAAAVRCQAACDEHRRRLDHLKAQFERCLTDFERIGQTEILLLAQENLASPGEETPIAGAGEEGPVALARRLAAAAGGGAGALGVTRRLHEEYTSLCAVAFEHRPQLDTVGGLLVATLGAEGNQGVVAFSRDLSRRADIARERLSAAERQAITDHLLREAADQLRERLLSAKLLIAAMNTQLRAHPTGSGVWLELSVEPLPEAREAVGFLSRPLGELDEGGRMVVEQFLLERIGGADRHDGADGAERLAGALDYRRWHSFSVWRCSADGRQRLTARSQSQGSGGEQAKLAHQPLFAAAAAYYASARADAPHLIALDEAFAGIDDRQRRDLFGMLTALDLDWVVTGYDTWACFDTVPAVSIYHLERTPGVLGVATLRFSWSANRLSEVDAGTALVPGSSSTE